MIKTMILAVFLLQMMIKETSKKSHISIALFTVNLLRNLLSNYSIFESKSLELEGKFMILNDENE